MIGAIILAAGQSRRMGAPKLLLPIGDKPMIARITDEVLAAALSPVIVVVADSTHSPVADALTGRSVHFVTNLQPQGDMLSSVRCGLRSISAECRAVLVVLGDQPGLSVALINLLFRAWDDGKHGIVVPVVQGRRGHPLLFTTKYAPEILTGFADTGLRGLLQTHPEDVLEVEVPMPEVLEDLDTPEDYQKIAARYSP